MKTSRYQVFWDALLRAFTDVGITQAIQLAAEAAHVSHPTATRWIHSPRPGHIKAPCSSAEARCRLLEAALDIWRGRWPIPEPMSAPPDHTGREYWGDALFPLGLLGVRSGGSLWQLIERACVVAAVVTGKAYPDWATRLVPAFTDVWSVELQDGPLGRVPTTSRSGPDYSLRVWLAFEPGPNQHPRRERTWTAAAYVSTRSRVVGFARMDVEPTEVREALPRMPYDDLHWSPARLRPHRARRYPDYLAMPMFPPPGNRSTSRGGVEPLFIVMKGWQDLDRDRHAADGFTRLFLEAQS